MPKKHRTSAIIEAKLRQINGMVAEGLGLPDAIRKLGISAATYNRWRLASGKAQSDQAERLKESEQENTRLRGTVSELASDNRILVEAAKGNF